MLFNITDLDSLQIKNAENIFIRGLGGGEPIKAIQSKGNTFSIHPDVKNFSQDLFVIVDEEINFSPRLGIPIHGIIGYDIFKEFVVKIDYSKKKLTLYNQDAFKKRPCRKCETLPLTVIKDRAYLDLYAQQDTTSIPVRLLLDTGSSDAIWLFEDVDHGIVEPQNFYVDFLGRGLSGSVFGKRAKLTALSIGDFRIKNVKCAFPFEENIGYLRFYADRNGSIGGEVLSKFNVIINFRDGEIVFKKNSRFRKPFLYNLSGVELQHNGMRVVRELEDLASNAGYGSNNNSEGKVISLVSLYTLILKPAIEVAEVRPGSPAAEAGLVKGDVILSINGKEAHHYTLQQLLEMINKEAGERIKLVVDRNGSNLIIGFTLKNIL